MPSKKMLITKPAAKRLRQLANSDPDGALRELKSMIAVRAGIDRATSFSIDAIRSGPKRKRPSFQTGSLDQEFAGDLDRQKMIATMRDIVLNFGFGTGIIGSHIKNVIGRGPRLHALTNDTEYNERAERYWNRRKNLLDVRGMPFAVNLRTGERREIVDGDYGTMIVQGGHVQYIEGDRIKNPPKQPTEKPKRGTKIVNGVEIVKSGGRPLGYHIWNRAARLGQKMTYAKKVPAENFIHSLSPTRFDQARGVCWLLSAINDLQDLRETLEAAKGKWKIENMLGLATKSAIPESSDLSNLFGALSDFTVADSKGNDETRYEVKMGQGVHSFDLRPGEEIQILESKTPNNTFEPMTMLLIRIIALSLDMPLEIALQFFTKGSFSSHRAAFLQYQQAVDMRRSEIEEITLDRLYRWVISRGIKNDELEGPKEGEDEWAHEWQWPGLLILDPDKERKGDISAYKLGVASIGSITGRSGEFWKDVTIERIEEIKWIIEQANAAGIDPALVLPIVTDPGQEPANSDAEDPEEKEDD